MEYKPIVFEKVKCVMCCEPISKPNTWNLMSHLMNRHHIKTPEFSSTKERYKWFFITQNYFDGVRI